MFLTEAWAQWLTGLGNKKTDQQKRIKIEAQEGKEWRKRGENRRQMGHS